MATITGITTMDRPETSAVMFRSILKSGVVAAILSLATAAFAQQGAAPAAQSAPSVNQPVVQAAPPPAAPVQSQAIPPTQSPAAASSTAGTSPVSPDAASPPPARPVMLQVPRELSPWSMFLSAD